MVGDVGDIITCAEFQIEIFLGYNFTGCRIFDFPIDFIIGLTTRSATASPVMCKAHSKVTHIKQQKYFRHLKRPGYNTESYIHGPLFSLLFGADSC